MAPPPEVVASANDKAFALACAREHKLVPPSIDPLIRVFEAQDCLEPGFAGKVQADVEAWPRWTQRDFTLKPRHGTAGRGRVSRLQEIAGAAERFAAAGGALLEPWLRRSHDLSVQLFIAPDGDVEILGSTKLITSRPGVTRGVAGTLGADGLSNSTSACDAEARAAAHQLASAASERGYFGPCGVDAFEFQGPDGFELRPIVELNARFTMGTVALGHLARAQLSPGTSFLFLAQASAERAQPLDHRVLGPERAGKVPLIAFSSDPGVLSCLLQ